MWDTNISEITRPVKCDDDCLQSGCPGHELHIKINSTSGTGMLCKDGVVLLHMDRRESEALLDMLLHIKYAY
jgi:hypothetical protein